MDSRHLIRRRSRHRPTRLVVGCLVIAAAAASPAVGAGAAHGAAPIIVTVAGSTYGFSGDGGPAREARLRQPHAVAFDRAGDAYIADALNHRVRRIDRRGVITTVAGDGTAGGGGDGGPALRAQLSEPHGVAVDPAGNLYISDSTNNRIRKVDHTGVITTVAGDGDPSDGGDGGPARKAHLHDPKQIAVGPGDQLYIADVGNHRVRRVDLTRGIITTVAGTGIEGYGGDGGPAVRAKLRGHFGVAAADDGSVYIADQTNQRVRKVDPSGRITTVAGTGQPGDSGDGGPATRARIDKPRAVAVDDRGDLWIGEEAGQRVRLVGPGGKITTVAGTGRAGYGGAGGPATAAQVNGLRGIAVDAAGNLWIADTFNNRVRMVSKTK